MAEDGEPADETAKPADGAGPAVAVSADSATAGKASPVGAVREASTRPLEATAGVPDHGERQIAHGAGAPPGPPSGRPAGAEAPAAESEVKIIEAPEATPVSEMVPALTPSEVKPVLPDEKGVVIFDDTAKIEWGEEKKPGAAPAEGAPEKAVEAGAAPAAPAPPEEGPGVSWGEPEPPGPVGERPGLPVHPSLPRQFAGTGKDIRMFVRNGTFLFLVGSAVYFLAAVYLLGVSLLNAPDEWAYRRAADSGVAGFLALGLSVGAFACMLLSRYKLEEPLRRNDVAAIRRRLPAAVGAGLVFGLVLGGLLLHLARIKVDELPFPRHPARKEEAPAGEKA